MCCANLLTNSRWLNSIVQIVEGVSSANEKSEGTGAIVSSKNVRPLKEGTIHHIVINDIVNLVEFDIAVTVNEKDTANGGIGIKVVGINLGGGLQNETANQLVNKIKFSVPLTFPSK